MFTIKINPQSQRMDEVDLCERFLEWQGFQYERQTNPHYSGIEIVRGERFIARGFIGLFHALESSGMFRC